MNCEPFGYILLHKHSFTSSDIRYVPPPCHMYKCLSHCFSKVKKEFSNANSMITFYPKLNSIVIESIPVDDPTKKIHRH